MGNKCCQNSSFADDSFLQMQLIYCSNQIAPLRKIVNNADISQLVKPYKFGDWNPAYGQTGLGIIYMPREYYYQGGVRKGKPHGTGRIAWANQDTYAGDISQGKGSGPGKLVCAKKGIQYQGQWSDGHPATGNLIYNGVKYEVSFKKQRELTIKLKDGTIYSGQIVKRNNQYIIEGKGRMTFIDGAYYDGHWKEGHMHGRGIFVWNKTGKRYEGDYHIGKKQGFGKYYYNNNKWYEGMWEDGKQHGEGVIFQNGHKIYSGRWNHGNQQIVNADRGLQYI